MKDWQEVHVLEFLCYHFRLKNVRKKMGGGSHTALQCVAHEFGYKFPGHIQEAKDLHFQEASEVLALRGCSS
jgi:hypothetical protein